MKERKPRPILLSNFFWGVGAIMSLQIFKKIREKLDYE